jgi:hypothetical protein
VHGPREVDPKISSDAWLAWARGPDGERVEGQADSPEGALDALTNAMRQSGQAFKVGVRATPIPVANGVRRFAVLAALLAACQWLPPTPTPPVQKAATIPIELTAGGCRYSVA